MPHPSRRGILRGLLASAALSAPGWSTPLLAAGPASVRMGDDTFALAFDSGLRARIEYDAGAYSAWPWPSSMEIGMAGGILPGQYRIANYECEALAIATNKCFTGAYRGVARPAANFSIERAMDEVAHRLSEVAEGATVLPRPERRHVEQCLRCQAELVQYRKILRAMRAMRTEVLEPAPGLVTDVLAHIEEAGERAAA